jgi:hypothetical protein
LRVLNEVFDATQNPLTKALTRFKHPEFFDTVKKPQSQAQQGVKDFDTFDIGSFNTAQSPYPRLFSASKPMTFITAPSRFIPRAAVLTALSVTALVGFAGAVHTVGVWNEGKAEELAQADEMADAVAAIEAKEAELAAQTELAGSYSELGLAQATCGDTLAQFYFQPGQPLATQLQQWGFDFGAPRYNTDQWVPLFDSAGLLAGAVRLDPATGQQVFVQSDQQSIDQASICNFNQLTKE